MPHLDAAIAKDHLSDWNALTWALYLTGALLFVTVAMLSADYLERSSSSTTDFGYSPERDISMAREVWSWVVGVISSSVFWILLMDITRHTSSGRMTIVVLLIATFFAAYCWLCAVQANTHLWTVVAAILTAATGYTAITETITRIAASIPTTVPALLLLILVIGGAIRTRTRSTYSTSQTQTQRW